MDEKNRKEIKPADDIVYDKGKFSWSDLWKLEDYWAIWLGAILLIIGLLIFIPRPPADMHERINTANAALQAEAEKAPFQTIAWHEANDAKNKISAKSEGYAKDLSAFLARPKGWVSNPVDAFYMSEEKAAAKSEAAAEKFATAKENTGTVLANAREAETAAAAAGFNNKDLNQQAENKIAAWRTALAAESSAKKAAETKPYNLISSLIVLGVAFGLFFALGTRFMGRNTREFLAGFPFVFLLAVLAYFLAAQTNIKSAGVGYVAWALILGLLISNTIGTPKRVMPAVQTEYYIKTGLVMLGASILLGKILLIGIPGIFVTWVVTPIVLISTFWFGQRILKIESKTLNMTISADMSVSGVSAAIATAAACRAKKEELTLAVGMSIIFTSVMMIVLPMVVKALGMHHVWGGAWIGGTVDSTGAVVAAGAFLSDTAMYVAATIKMIQNVLIGLIAFGVAWYWCAKVECAEGQKVSYKEIWFRFPKFVLGFLGASVVFSLIYQSMGTDVANVMIDQGVVSVWTKTLQGWFFCLAFVSIGLATNFRELGKYLKGGKPLILYICGQSFNLFLTLVVAYIMFFLVFPDITARIAGQ